MKFASIKKTKTVKIDMKDTTAISHREVGY